MLWITNNENLSGIHITKELNGRPIINHGPKTTFTEDGEVVCKNSKVGECIIRNLVGTCSVDTPIGKKTIKIINSTFYRPFASPVYACDLKLNLNRRKPYLYRNLNDLISEIERLDGEIKDLEQQREEEQLRIKKQKEADYSNKLNEIVTQIEQKTLERNQTLAQAQSFIRKKAELRYQPILDPTQEEIKRSNIFNSPIIIDGGPGTGKTTTLIQRIKFLIDEKALDDYSPNLSIGLRAKLIDQDRSWTLFTPSELLKLFLKNNMVQEGLKANDEKVRVWPAFKEILIKKYNLVNPETQKNFKILRKNAELSIFPSKAEELKKIIDSFENYYLRYQKGKIEKLSQIDLTPFLWKKKINQYRII